MTIKYKVSDVAKDLNVPAKQIVDLLAQKGGEVKKTGANLTEKEVNLVFEHFTQASRGQPGCLSGQRTQAPAQGQRGAEEGRRHCGGDEQQ